MLRFIALIAAIILNFNCVLSVNCPKNTKDGNMNQAMSLYNAINKHVKDTCSKSNNGAVKQAFFDASNQCLNKHLTPYLTQDCINTDLVTNTVNKCVINTNDYTANAICTSDSQDRISKCFKAAINENKDGLKSLFQDYLGVIVKQGKAFESCYKTAMKLL